MARIIESDNRANFARDLVKGEVGEEAVFRWLSSLPSVSEVTDLRSVYGWQQKDIDFSVLVKPKKDQRFPTTLYWEVKTDSYPDINGTLSYEIISNFQRGTIGCALKTKSDFIGFYCPESHRLFYWRTEALRGWVAQKATSFELIKVLNHHQGSAEPQVTLCLKVPVTEALSACGGKAVNIDKPEPQDEEQFTGFTWTIEKDTDY